MAQRLRRHSKDPGHPLIPFSGVLVALAATIAGLIGLWPSGDPRADLERIGVVRETYPATVTGVSMGPCMGLPPDSPTRCTSVAFQLGEGPDRGRSVLIDFPLSANAPDLSDGDDVVLGRQPDAEPGFEYIYLDRQRRPILLALAALFALVVVLLGRVRGLAALAGLAATFGVLLLFVLPAVLDGRSPLLVAVVGASAIAYLALYLAHGFTLMTTVALLGTLASLGVTAALATLFVDLAQFTGLISDEAALVTIGAGELDLSGLVLGGVVIGALGAIDDMTVTQASAVWELRAANPEMERQAVFRSGLRIGRDHVASTVNTLFLAYAGASMPLLLLFVLSRQSLGTVANGEVVATEIVRTLVGSIGLVAAVPITTWLAARLAPAYGPHALTARSRRAERRRMRKAREEEERWPGEG